LKKEAKNFYSLRLFMRTISRLEKTLFRLQAQHACLAMLFAAIKDTPGVVAELGLGHGRTFDHLRRHLPTHPIYAFDRANDAYKDCQPEPAFLVLGDIFDTLPEFARRFPHGVILANSDIGSFERDRNTASAAAMSRALPPAIAPGGYVMSDLPLDLLGFTPLPLPAGAPPEAYYLYQRPA
jgi:hypothetical protein